MTQTRFVFEVRGGGGVTISTTVQVGKSHVVHDKVNLLSLTTCVCVQLRPVNLNTLSLTYPSRSRSPKLGLSLHPGCGGLPC